MLRVENCDGGTGVGTLSGRTDEETDVAGRRRRSVVTILALLVLVLSFGAWTAWTTARTTVSRFTLGTGQQPFRGDSALSAELGNPRAGGLVLDTISAGVSRTGGRGPLLPEFTFKVANARKPKVSSLRMRATLELGFQGWTVHGIEVLR
jgi:hypothetical protein